MPSPIYSGSGYNDSMDNDMILSSTSFSLETSDNYDTSSASLQTNFNSSPGSYPLSWSGSSEGSSYSYSSPSSPNFPAVGEIVPDLTYQPATYPDLHPGTEGQSRAVLYSRLSPTLDSMAPRRMPDDQVEINSTREDIPLVCLYPGCNARPRRRADLDRHYKNVHRSNSKEVFTCDYGRCPRSNQPFNRRDHFRDHLRDFHKEDIEKRGSNGTGTVSSTSSVTANRNWWRCSKCLHRVQISVDGFSCPDCKAQCEPSRMARRQQHKQQNQQRRR
ncbi:hypothetical protein B0I35DRAFT_474530 [Stachybotrys elegans]|uniref:C2H2-type domain-containing protein n=1 Tax=Stachybotrys elegans TaxID=80388 RepID=A0A8K0T3F8_9HYPO|nr:hypothetical protein B0I35DRAFT_474530 [Stachybotrys elegans]